MNTDMQKQGPLLEKLSELFARSFSNAKIGIYASSDAEATGISYEDYLPLGTSIPPGDSL